MPNSCVHVYVHFVWATWDRMPLITPELEPAIHGCVAQICDEERCDLLEIGGTEDHTHTLVRLHATASVAELANRMKGSSSHLVTRALVPGKFFKWQGSYGAFSVSPTDLGEVRSYIRRQKQHHADGSAVEEWERCVEEDAVEA